MAIGAMRAVRAPGRTVPDDFSVVGFDDVAIAAYTDPPLTTIAQDIGDLGRWAVERLVERIAAATGRPAAPDRPPGRPPRSVGRAGRRRAERRPGRRDLRARRGSSSPACADLLGSIARTASGAASRASRPWPPGPRPRTAPVLDDQGASSRRESQIERVADRRAPLRTIPSLPAAPRNPDAWSAARNVSPAPVGSISRSLAGDR